MIALWSWKNLITRPIGGPSENMQEHAHTYICITNTKIKILQHNQRDMPPLDLNKAAAFHISVFKLF